MIKNCIIFVQFYLNNNTYFNYNDRLNNSITDFSHVITYLKLKILAQSKEYTELLQFLLGLIYSMKIGEREREKKYCKP